jgi:hypothetical protein
MAETVVSITKALLIILLFSISACAERTSLGPCIGAFDERDPHLIYKPSGWNIAMAIIFIETIFVPIVVIFDETQCPIGVREKTIATPRASE